MEIDLTKPIKIMPTTDDHARSLFELEEFEGEAVERFDFERDDEMAKLFENAPRTKLEHSKMLEWLKKWGLYT